MEKKQIALSAAAVASAISALSHMGQSNNIAEVSSTGGNYQEKAKAAVANSQSQMLIRQQTPLIASTVKLDGELLSEKYVTIAGRGPQHPLGTDSTLDYEGGNDNYTANFWGCYQNCHAACHGSRGWR